MKICIRCGEDRPLNFYVKGRGKDGLHPWCKPCRSEYYKEYRQGYSRPKASPESIRQSNLKATYNITVDEYEKLLEAQGGRCAICPDTPTDGRKRFHVDHDHNCCPGAKSCGKCIRGILCHSCNVALGFIKDDPATLRAMIRYLDF